MFSRHHLILRTSWFHCHTLYSCCFRLLCLQSPSKKMKKHKHDKIKWFLNMFKNFNTTYFAWCTFKRVDSFFDLILVWGSIFELLCPVVVFNNRLYNLIRNRVGPHSQLENEMTLVHEKQSFSVWFFLFIYTYSVVDK